MKLCKDELEQIKIKVDGLLDIGGFSCLTYSSFQLTLSSENADPAIKSALETCETKLKEVKEALANLEAFEMKLDDRLEQDEQTIAMVQDKLDEIRHLEHLNEYHILIRDIQNISIELKSCVNSKDESKTIGLYVALSGPMSNSILDRLSTVDAPHLKMYARNTAIYWHDILKEKFSK